MKMLFKMSLALIAAVLVAGLMYSCRDDDDDDESNNANNPDNIATSNLIAYFPFDSEPAAGSAVENSNNSVSFVRRAGAARFVAGRRGNAYQGSDSLAYLEYDVAAGSPFTALDEFSLACWIKTPALTNGSAVIFTLNGGDVFQGNITLLHESRAVGDSVDLKLFLFDSASPIWKGQDIRINKRDFVNDKWFHLVALYDKASSTMEFFANGRQVFSQVKYAGPVPAEGGTQPLLEGITLGSDISKAYFGTWLQQVAGTPLDYMTYYKGLLDEFRIYDKALTDSEVRDLYEAEVSQIDE